MTTEVQSSAPKLNYGKTFLIGFGFFGLSVMWKLYNDYVPIFLQAGNPGFEMATRANGFGLGATWTGFIMTLDNIIALFLLPLIGMWSDRVWVKRLGRRKPFIVTLAPISILAFLFIPVIVKSIPPELSGMTSELRQPLALFIAAVGIFITAMAGFRTPVISLMPDLTPSPLRSQANGIINLMGGLGGVIITLVGAQLYALNIALPFIVAGVLMFSALLMLVFFVKEPRHLDSDVPPEREEDVGLGIIKNLRQVAPEARKSLLLLMLSIFLWFVGYNAIETFFTSYGVNVLKITENNAAMLGSVAYVTFIIFAIPSGYISAKVGRKRAITMGLLIFAGLLAIGYFTPNAIVIGVLLGLGGLAWALVNINSLPMVIDTSDTDANIGTFTGFYYLASQLAAIAGPTLNGFVIERFENYGLVLLMPVIFFALAAVTMQGVTRGEARS
ncbi:MAG: MFS transporter [Chloroflexi bacterium]|jgi:MFS family permease|nr:MFS transporter [Chloroflexota bacterium]